MVYNHVIITLVLLYILEFILLNTANWLEIVTFGTCEASRGWVKNVDSGQSECNNDVLERARVVDLICHHLITVASVDVAFANLFLERVQEKGVSNLIRFPSENQNYFSLFLVRFVCTRRNKWDHTKGSQVFGPCVKLKFKELKFGLFRDGFFTWIEKAICL